MLVFPVYYSKARVRTLRSIKWIENWEESCEDAQKTGLKLRKTKFHREAGAEDKPRSWAMIPTIMGMSRSLDRGNPTTQIVRTAHIPEMLIFYIFFQIPRSFTWLRSWGPLCHPIFTYYCYISDQNHIDSTLICLNTVCAHFGQIQSFCRQVRKTQGFGPYILFYYVILFV